MEQQSDAWYWVTDPREGDVWTPAYVRGDGTTIIDGKMYKTESLTSLVWRKAIMPDKI